ncbi:bifunctional 2-polyprenyl-6-hydroxyphenol methylase/3-demethylubiquinol 3-O-methyltransferase UbiG [Thorsellia kenyensis]|uniref:Ubiquinone biosynthesis O-methyltransferase n=1 Tax=Thorsellia kenyensis TaxID=1549888 RepID=A0ABV6CAM4_9GAMM
MDKQNSNANVDAKEIEKFNSIATKWWDLEGEFKPLHRINPLRLGYIAERSEGLFEKKVLDVGCGGGILSESLAKEGAIVTGIDMGAEPLEVARLHALESGLTIDYIQTTAEDYANNHPGQYDVVTCMEMLEHVPDPSSVVRACATLVKPGGMIFFSTINRNVKSFLGAIVAAEYILRWVPRGTHDIKKCIKPSELIQFIDAADLETVHMIGLNFNPLRNQFYLSDDVDINYMVCARKPH